MKKAFKIIGNIIAWVSLIAMLFAIVALLVTRFSGGVPSFFGYRLYVISTGSMEPELKVGDVILSRTFNVGDELTKGDILTYEGQDSMSGFLITHRLMKIEGEVGNRSLILRGDANNASDSPIDESLIVSKYICKLRLFGKLVSLMQSKFGIPLVILFILIFIIFEAVDFSKIIDSKKKDENSIQKK